MRRLVGLAFAVLTLAAGTPASATGLVPVTYQAPVDAPVVDVFRPPDSPFGPGNRGIDYATVPGTMVRSAGAGEVTFAGPVGGSLHVVVLHGDGMRTSYSFLASVGVSRGERVQLGQTIGAAGGPFHFGARAGDTYVDPLLLIEGSRPAVHLVPDDGAGREDPRVERNRLERMLEGLRRAGVPVGRAALSWAGQLAGAAVGPTPRDELLASLDLLGPPVWALPVRLAAASRAWAEARTTCTPPGVAPPGPGERRLAVLVAGLGSSSSAAAVYAIDTAALGYASADVVRFSYRGGTTSEHGYGPADTQVDIRASGRRLRALLERMHAENPGVPIDVIAHSQGGLVARSALGDGAPPSVANLVTLGTPHHGSDLATALGAVSATPAVVGTAALARGLGVSGIDPHSQSVRQLSETSSYIADLNARPLPQGVRVVSIAARGDVVVAWPRSRLSGATNVVVPVPALSQHSALPGSAAAHREVALALRGRAPTCETLADALADEVAGMAIGQSGDAVGLVLAAP